MTSENDIVPCPFCDGEEPGVPRFKAESLLRPAPIEAARPEVEKLVEALQDAIEGMEDMIGYVDRFFQWKHDHQGYIDRAKAALPPSPASTPSTNGEVK